MDEEPTESEERLIDWLCWVWATEGERFYPPDETAEECMDHFVDEEFYEEGTESYYKSLGWEKGQHTRAYATSLERFKDLQNRGYDPVARAEREIERSRENGLNVDDIDWAWLEERGLK